MKLDVKTFNNELPARQFTLSGVISINFTKALIGGCLEANITLDRKPNRAYLDVAFNYHLQLTDKTGYVFWEGRIHALPQGKDFQIKAVGYYSNLADLTSVWLPYYPVATELSTIILEGINGTIARNGFGAMPAGAPALVATSTTVPATGTLITYTPDNATSVREHLDEIISKYGNSVFSTLYWQIGIGRKFNLLPRPYTSTPLYSAILTSADDYQVGLSADGFYNRVTVRYKTFYDTALLTVDNLPMQKKYASNFGSADPTFVPVPLIRETAIVDITSHGLVSVAQATVVANTLLARYSNEGVRVLASSATFSSGNSISVDGSFQKCPLYSINPGQMILWKDLAGANQLYSNYQSTMLIGQVTYNESDGKSSVTLQSEDAQSIDNLLSGLLINLDNQLAS